MRRVLVVDDNIAFAENLAEIIGDAGVGDTVVADSGDHGLSLVRESRFHVLITDMRMPGMDGAALIRHVRAVDPSLPIVVVTAFSGADQLRDVADEGVLAVFAKPPPIAEVLRAITDARRGIVLIVGDTSSALARDVAAMLRARGIAYVAVVDPKQVVLLAAAAVIALVDVMADGDRWAPLAARFPAAAVVDASNTRQALTAIETMCDSANGDIR